MLDAGGIQTAELFKVICDRLWQASGDNVLSP